MTIDSISGATSAYTQTSQSTHHRHQPDLSSTAQLLGISTDQLQSDLQSGDTLSSLASSADVSSSDLLSSVESDLKANAPDGAPALSDSQLSSMATDIINGTGPSSSTSGSSSTDTAASNLNALASTLGMDPSDLISALTSGGDLSQLLNAGGETGYGSSATDLIQGGVIFDQYA